MKRNGIALIVHPYKNMLVAKEKLHEYSNSFAQKLLSITNAHPNLRLNLVLPGYVLQLIDPLLVSQLNEVQKNNCLEWLTTGFTEPFISFSPLWLCEENVKYGLDIFQELVGNKPSTFVPPFSNWEPPTIEMLKNNGISSVVVSKELFPRNCQNYCGYWITEFNSKTMALVPTHNLHYYNAPANILNWVERQIDNHQNGTQLKILTLEYLVPLVPDIPERNADPFQWLKAFAASLDTLLIHFQLSLMHEITSLVHPLGLQYLPSSLLFKPAEVESYNFFSNYLFTFDTVGIMQRKMLAIAEDIKSFAHTKEGMGLTKQLFFIQDINRFLPGRSSGVQDINDRNWTFGRMIEIEHELIKRQPVKGGQIRIADVLRNGMKTIVLSNNAITVYIDYKQGGQILEMDYLTRHVNLCAAAHPENHMPPRITSIGKSRTSFIDHFLPDDCQMPDFINIMTKELGDFVSGEFEYKVKKVVSGAKAILTRQGSLINNGKIFPVTMEKVLGLETDSPELSFAYQLSNHSLTPYSFKFAIECNFSFPGALSQHAEISCNGRTANNFIWERTTFDQTTSWVISDSTLGTAIEIVTQKPVALWCYPISQSIPYQGTTVVLSIPVTLEGNAVWSLVGRITLKKIRVRGAVTDVI